MADQAQQFPSRPDTTERWILILVGVVYFFSARGYIQVSDTTYSMKTAAALVHEGKLDIPPDAGYTMTARDGLSYAKYGLGLPLLYVPVVAVGGLAAQLTGQSPPVVVSALISFFNIPFALLTLVLFARMLKHFGIRPASVHLLTLGLGLGTLCWRYAVSDFSEALQMALLLLAVYGVVRGTLDWVCYGGIGFAGLILVKLFHIVFLPLILGYLLLRGKGGWWQLLRDLVLFLVPLMIAFGLIAGYNAIRFGTPLESGYGGEASQFKLAQMPDVIPRLLFSLDKGMFLFSPLLLLGLLGWISFGRERPREAALSAGLVLMNLGFIGAWYGWGGGWAWGPRLLIPTLPFWLLPAAFWLEGGRPRVRYRIAVVLLLGSVVAQLPGILTRDNEINQIREGELTPAERNWMLADYPAGWALVRHKLSVGNEVYRSRELGVPDDRELDLSSNWSYQGFDVWTEHLGRQWAMPLIRWLPALGLLLLLWATMQLIKRLRIISPKGQAPSPPDANVRS